MQLKSEEMHLNYVVISCCCYFVIHFSWIFKRCFFCHFSLIFWSDEFGQADVKGLNPCIKHTLEKKYAWVHIFYITQAKTSFTINILYLFHSPLGGSLTQVGTHGLNPKTAIYFLKQRRQTLAHHWKDKSKNPVILLTYDWPRCSVWFNRALLDCILIYITL